jgi:IclR family pca regulon transcriptional regulator
MDKDLGQDFVQSLQRGLSVIRTFDAAHSELTLTEVARATGLTRATARRFLLTLESLGYVRASEGRFSLRPRVLELGYAYLAALGLPEIARPYMQRAVAERNESCSIGVLDDTEVVYVARITANRPVGSVMTVGTRLPAYASSLGRVMLAALPDDALDQLIEQLDLQPLTRHTVRDKAKFREAIAQTRRKDYAIVDQELDDGWRSVAVPIRDWTGETIAALNISTQASRNSLAVLKREFLPLAREAVAAIETDLRRVGGSPSRNWAMSRA